MEMSGNLTEQCVTIGNAAGRAYTGVHGDGKLSSAAEANVAGWSTGMLGARGEAYPYSDNGLRTSERGEAATGGISRSGYNGIRGARTAP